MSSHCGAQAASSAGISLLAMAYRDVLKDVFSVQFRELASASKWYRHTLPPDDVFRLWVLDNLNSGTRSTWVFDPIRANERPLLCDMLGFPRSEIIGKSPHVLADRILHHCGLSLQFGRSTDAERRLWKEAAEMVDRGDDELASVQLRAMAERFLKRVLHFHAATSLGDKLLQVIRSPGNLRVPADFAAAASGSEEHALAGVLSFLSSEGRADLGFLVLIVRKVQAAIDSAGVPNNGETPQLLLLDAAEQHSFDALARALQSYAHDKPTKLTTRNSELSAAVGHTREVVERMIARGTVPDEGIVRACGDSLFGRFFRVQTEERSRIICSVSTPTIGQRILFVADCDCDYSCGRWTASPWPP